MGSRRELHTGSVCARARGARCTRAYYRGGDNGAAHVAGRPHARQYPDAPPRGCRHHHPIDRARQRCEGGRRIDESAAADGGAASERGAGGARAARSAARDRLRSARADPARRRG